MSRIHRDYVSAGPLVHKILFYGALTLAVIMLGLSLSMEAKADEIVVKETHTWQERFASSSEGPAMYWPGSTSIVYNDAGSPLSDTESVAAMEYAAWSWSEHSEREFPYSGTTSSSGGEDGKITVMWIDAFKMDESGRDMFTKAFSRIYYYSSSGEIVGVQVYLNSTILSSGGPCATQAALHEVGHSLGAPHSDSSDDVMFWTGAIDCRYALSAADVSLLQYGSDTCFVELTQENDLYIPMVEGRAALLKFYGEDSWELDQYTQSLGSCSSVTVEDDMDLIFSDVRTNGEQFGNVELEWTGDVTGKDTWRLRYAE